MNSSQLTRTTRGFNTQALAGALFRAEVPEHEVRALPAQSLYMALKHNGLGSSAGLIELASLEQCQLMLDLDCWRKDRFDEGNFWEWLGLSDEANDLGILQKLFKCMDLKIVALMIQRYVEFQFFEEATDLPPDVNYYTTDMGRTWLRVNVEDAHNHFLLSRLLALIFETNADLFYQLLTVSSTETAASLEEVSYQDKSRRLRAEGIPDAELAFEINSALQEKQALAEIEASTFHAVVRDINTIDPLIAGMSRLQPLSSLIDQIDSREFFESELTLIMNGAIIRFGVDFCEQDQIYELIGRVRGALNTGLEALLASSNRAPSDIYQALGAVKIYRVGLGKLEELRSAALKARASQNDITDSIYLTFLDSVSEAFPVMPAYMDDEGTFQSADGADKLPAGCKPIEHLETVRKLREIVRRGTLQ